jgi:hypothetical protein
MIAGGSQRRMRNGMGASFREDHFALGLALYAGYEWITIREGGNDGSTDTYPTTSTPIPDSEDSGTPPPPPSVDSGDTGAPSDTSGLEQHGRRGAHGVHRRVAASAVRSEGPTNIGVGTAAKRSRRQ